MGSHLITDRGRERPSRNQSREREVAVVINNTKMGLQQEKGRGG